VALLPKKYLRIHDVAEYLNSLDAGYEYDLSESSDRYKLNDDIYDLVVHGELKAVFKHFTEDFTQAYFIVYDKELEAILRFNSWQNMSDAYLIYSYMSGTKPEKDKIVKIINDGSLKFDDIYIPKEELDALFNPSNSPIKQLESLKTKNDELNARLSKASDIYWQNQSEIKELKVQLEKASAESADLNEKLSNKTDVPADVEPLQGIAKYNADKSYVISTSQALASYIWSMDTEKAIRTGDMVQQVRHVMHKVAPKLLPDDKAIREWLSSIAPDYAKKGGKTPKDAPDEISLIMKK